MTQSYTTSREDHIIIMTTEEDTTTMKTRAGSYNTATTTPTTNNDDAESYYSDYVIAVDIDKDFLLDIETGIPTSTEPHTCAAITPKMRNSSLSATNTTVPSVIDISIATTIPTSNNDDTTTAASKAMNMKTNPMPCSSCPDEDDDEVYDRDNLDNKHQPCSSIGDTDNVGCCCCCCTGRCCTVLLFIYDLYARNKFIVATIVSIVLLITIIGLGEYLTST